MPFPLDTGVRLVGLPVLGAVAMHLWSRYRSRMVDLRWTERITPLVFATEDTGWGEVAVLYDGNPAKALHMCNIEIQNASSRDLSDVIVTAVANDGTSVLRGAGRLRGGASPFPFSDAFSSTFKKLGDGELSDAEIQAALPRMEFRIPVLNRGATSDISLLLSRDDYATPSINVAIEHIGTRATHQELEEFTWGVRDGQATSVGLVLSIVASVTAVLMRWPSWSVALTAWLTGILSIYTGAVVVRLWRRVISLAD